MRGTRQSLILLAAALACFAGAEGVQSAQTNHAELKISGYGFFGNRKLKTLLKNAQPEKTAPPFYDANFIEDAALLLIANLQRDGYLNPRVAARITQAGNKKVSFEWRNRQREPLPRPLHARKAHFKISRGILYHYDSVEIEGLQKTRLKQARAFFIETDVPAPLKRTRIYTPEKLKHSLANLKETLERRGFEHAAIDVAQLERNDANGHVSVRIKVVEGPKSIVRSIRKEVWLNETNQIHESGVIQTNAVFSQAWAQDFKQSLKTIYFHQGYPDVVVEVVTVAKEERGDHLELDLLATIRTGPQFVLNQIKFDGHKKTRLSLLRRRVRLKEGDKLDRTKVEEGRYRLARLGVFDSVQLRYDLVNEHQRNVFYGLKEGQRIDFSVLAGYGSYEMLRGGLQVEQFNVFGLAHHARLRLIQSFKSSSADYTYNVPELVGRDVDLFFTASGLRREEVSFLREEYGGGVGLRRYFQTISSGLSARYQYQVLNASDAQPAIAAEGRRFASVGTIITELRHDRRDNPLYPRRGYKIFSNLEIGADYLGGDANYQRFEAAGACHFPLYRGAWMNLGLSHGVVVTSGAPEKDLPFNRRFFPGGENSIRGYPEGQASPRDAAGNFVGAESYLLGNIEFEQALTRSFSLVLFSDGIGFARELKDYPLNHALFSAGAGLRWKTLVGPIRLEYGHNLNPRSGGPLGALHFSMGFPF